MGEQEDRQKNMPVLKSNSYRNNVLEHQVACDIHFEVGPDDPATEVISAHKTNLMSRSRVFRKMFCGELKELGSMVRVKDIDPETFRDVLE